MREAGRTRPDPRALESVLRAVDFVEERLGDPVGVEDMARAAFYSPFYFSRLFAQAVGHSPYDYLMRRRVAAAAEEVVGGDRNLTALALDYGFEAPDSFSRAFRRCFGMLPSEARKAGTYPRRIARTRIDPGYAADMLESPPGPPERVETGDLVLSGGDPGLAPGPGVFEIVRRAEDLGAEHVFCGARHDRTAKVAGTVPEIPSYPGLSTLVPAGTFARFRLPRGAAGLRTAVEYAYRAWLPGVGNLAVPAYDLVEYGEGGPEALWVPAGRGDSQKLSNPAASFSM